MSSIDRFALLQDCYSYMNKVTASQTIDLATAKRINQANVITLSKQVAGSNQNFSTSLVAESKNGDVFEIAGEPVWKKSTHLVLYSSFKGKIPSSFSGTLFNQHIKLAEKSDNLEMSQLFFFVPSITDRKESLHQYLKNVNITPIDVHKKQLDTLCGETFDPSKLDLKSAKMGSVVISVLKETASISNSNLKRNSDTLICKENISDESVEWANAVNRSIPEKFKLSY